MTRGSCRTAIPDGRRAGIDSGRLLLAIGITGTTELVAKVCIAPSSHRHDLCWSPVETTTDRLSERGSLSAVGDPVKRVCGWKGELNFTGNACERPRSPAITSDEPDGFGIFPVTTGH